ncbi:hypothetical protein XENTR_v10023238 [Xenopus tropicalis]|nr:hypothetical protein XENTR_v10023238 [Xenopus tropicalis]
MFHLLVSGVDNSESDLNTHVVKVTRLAKVKFTLRIYFLCGFCQLYYLCYRPVGRETEKTISCVQSSLGYSLLINQAF